MIEIIKEKKVLISRPKCEDNFDSYLSLKKKGQSLRLVKDHFDHGEKGRFVNPISKTISISGQSEVACGYIYIRASKSGKPLNDEYDSIYIKPHDFGGHILRNRGILLNNTDNFTEALLLLDSISYLPNTPYNSDAMNYRIADWSKMLNVNSHITFNFGLSTMDRGGKIEDITIVYKCWNPETGEETNNCQLSIE